MNMPTETFLTTLYTIVDDWYQKHAPRSVAGRAGKKPIFSDSEVMTLSIAQHWLGIPDEREFLRFVQNNCLPLFPRLISQGQFNRRARNLCWLIHTMRQHLVAQMGIATTPCQLIPASLLTERRCICGTGDASAKVIYSCPKRHWASAPPRKKPTTASVCWR